MAWSPASSLWGRLLNFEADQELAPEENPSIVRTPLVIAMWEPFARALGWPKRQIGFEQIIQLARSNQGFAAFGHPEFGRFKLVHTNPDFSTSGLEAVVAEYYAATGKQEGLTEQDVESSKARAIVRDIERSIVHYGDTTLFIADQMRKEGPGYASAVAMEEVTLLDFNRNRGPQPKLIALYPPEGTFYSDNPFIVLNGAWVRPAQRQGAERFQEFLAEEITPELAARSGFRPADLETEAVAPVSKENGVDPAQPKRVLGLPEPRTLDRIRRAWREDRKPANVLLVVDTSGSMNDEDRLVRAKKGLDAFFEQVGKQDSVGLNIFSDQLQSLLPIAPFRENERQMRQTVDNLIADGGTAVYDATIEGFETVRADAGPDRINAVVVLTDGEDTDSAASAARRRRGRALPGRLGRAGARVHDCLQRRCAGRRRGAGRRSRRPRAVSPMKATPRTSRPSTEASRASSDARRDAPLQQVRVQPRADRERAHAAVQRLPARGDRDRRAAARPAAAAAHRRHRRLRDRRRAHLLRRGRGEQGAHARAQGAPRAARGGPRSTRASCPRRSPGS